MVLYGKIIKDKILYAILGMKILVLILFSSEYSSGLFLPFVNTFINGHFNPWQYYFENNLNLNSFPYHGQMLYIFSIPTAFINLFNIENNIIINFLFKIPLLIADLGILYVLIQLFPHKEKSVYIYYFFNPIILYAIYIHSQLDMIPTSLLFFSIYFITLKKYKTSSFFVGLALASKLHIIIALPLILFYLYKIENIKVTVKYITLVLLIFLLIDLPFIFSEGFMHMVLFNAKQLLLFDSFYKMGELKLLLPVAAILSVYFHFFNQKKVNEDLLFFYFGLLFTVTIFFIYPAPAWYVWMIPFISIYFIQSTNTKKGLLLYLVLSMTYLVFFVFFYKSEYKDVLFLGQAINLKIDSERLINISFTILEVMLLAIMYAFYKYGIKSNSIYKKRTNLSIGIGGDSGVGKTTLINSLEGILGEKLLKIEGDGEHKWERGDENWSKFTHLDPKANHMHKQAEAIYKLKHNNIIYRSEYDHKTGKFTELLKVVPKEFIVIAGLHPFYLPKLRKNIDLKFYIDTDEKLRRHWKIIRDTNKRGYSIEKILNQIETRMEDAKKYIYPQKEFSDMVINYFPINEFELGNEKEHIQLGLKVTFDANIHVEDILNKLNLSYIWDYNDDLLSQYIELREIPNINFEDIAIDTIENIREIVSMNLMFQSGFDGFIQLISLKMISEKLKEVKE